jgi:hypothetical protein
MHISGLFKIKTKSLVWIQGIFGAVSMELLPRDCPLSLQKPFQDLSFSVFAQNLILIAKRRSLYRLSAYGET